jgi:hypothetical protein
MSSVSKYNLEIATAREKNKKARFPSDLPGKRALEEMS